MSDWEKVEDSEKEKFKRTESFSLSLEGVPFVDHSEVKESLSQIVSLLKTKWNFTHMIIIQKQYLELM